jgi:hypothetical protein
MTGQKQNIKRLAIIKYSLEEYARAADSLPSTLSSGALMQLVQAYAALQ